jgi:uncharacterized protein YggE
MIRGFRKTASFALAAMLPLTLAVPARGQEPTIALAPGEVLLKVEAQGVSRARPDLMSLSAGVVTTGRTAREALAANNQLANRLIAAVRAQGVAATDIRTDELSVQPQLPDRDRIGMRLSRPHRASPVTSRRIIFRSPCAT